MNYKHIISSIICTVSILFCDAHSIVAQDVTFTLTNPHTVNDAGEDYFVADVLTYSNAGFKLGSGQLYFNYDTTVLGANVFQNNNLEIIIPDSSILDKKVGVPPFEFDFYGNHIINDNTYSRFSFSWQHDFSAACLDTGNIEYHSDILLTVKIKYKNGQAGNNPSLCLEAGPNFVDQTYTACGPTPCNTNDCFNHPGTQLLSDNYPCDDCRIVYSTGDDGVGTLREAISCANSGDTIRFSKSLKLDSIQLTSAFLTIDKDLSVIAKEDFRIFVNGDQLNRTFDILTGNTVLIEGLRMGQGIAPQGSSIRNAGDLTIKDISIYYTSEQVDGSHIYNLGTINIVGNIIISEP